MKIALMCGAAALLSLGCAPFAQARADDERSPDDAAAPEPITVQYVPLLPAAGLMNEHMHDGGELMIALRWIHQRSSGGNVSATDAIADADVLAAGYSVRAKSMTMDMAMLDIMYAPSDTVTLMVMPHWMRHEMTMIGIDPMSGGMDMDMDMGAEHGGHHAIPFGQTMTHATQGFGDTLVSGSYRLARGRGFNAHATLGLWVPTGSVQRRNDDGTYVHYGMQGGSGTFDLEPSLTVSGESGPIGWGAQAAYRWRSSDANSAGFAFGDEARASAWLSYAPAPAISTTARIGWEHEGAILGHYDGAHNHAAPPDRQANYGGDIVLGAIGLNALLPVGGANRPQIGVELGVPLYQDLNGIQLPEDWRLAISIGRTF